MTTPAYATVSSNQISLLKVVVNNKNNRKTSNKQQKEKTERGENLLEPTVVWFADLKHMAHGEVGRHWRQRSCCLAVLF
jgi:hypothetical protein